MTEKDASIQRMKNLMKEHSLKYVFLKRPIYTTHPGLGKPNSDKRPYTISAIRYYENADSLEFWQHWSDYHVGNSARFFEDEKVYLVESALKETIESLGEYKVIVTAEVVVKATSLENAKKTAQNMPSPDINEALGCIVPTGDVKLLGEPDAQ